MISSFAFVLLEVEVAEVALDTHFRVMEVPKHQLKKQPENHQKLAEKLHLTPTLGWWRFPKITEKITLKISGNCPKNYI